MLFWRKKKLSTNTPPIRGVNLGGWLLLEPWITPSIFKDILAADEYTLCKLDSDSIKRKIEVHRETFVTYADFEWLAKQGISAIRLPVGYWVFGDTPPFIGNIEYVDKAFDWAEKTNIKILLDLHGAPGSQNGWQESGKIGGIGWPENERNIIVSLQVIDKLSRRYAGHPSLLGIELLNEPHPKIKQSVLKKYYKAGYNIIRKNCGSKTWVVFSDNFKPRRWAWHLWKSKYPEMYIDTHQYQAYTPSDRRLNVAGHINKTFGTVNRQISKMSLHHPVIVGEWSLVLDGESTQGLSPIQLEAARRAYGNAQLMTYEQAAAWFYWTYRTEEGGIWSFRDCIEKCWLPKF